MFFLTPMCLYIYEPSQLIPTIIMALLRRLFFLGLLLVFLMDFVACTTTTGPSASNTPTQKTETVTQTPESTPYPEPISENPATPYPSSPTEISSPTPEPALWIADHVPEAVSAHVIQQVGEQVLLVDNREDATLILDAGGDWVPSSWRTALPVAQWVYALVAPFPTVTDGISEIELEQAWRGELETGPFANLPLMMSEDTYAIFSTMSGEVAPEAVRLVPADELLVTAWEEQASWGIVPFEQLDPRWKVLQIDGVSPIQKDFADYPLTANFILVGDPTAVNASISNYDPNKFTDIMLTGVTALVRGTALTMERKGVLYPGEDIAPLTTQVDFMHVNNEIPFTPDCPFPELYPEYLVFCSDVSYLELLQSIGADFVEVSGDHFGDHGSEGTLFTLDLYGEVGLPYYGGGRNLEDGQKPLLFNHNGNKIAIIGCNAKGSNYYAPADENTPGAVPCDFEWMEAEIERLKEAGYLVIVTLQHIEYYSYEAQPDLVRDFGRMAEAGAVIVSGSQSHQPHGFAFQHNTYIHYGLGNLFFDQYLYCENASCDYGFMDRHIFYEGQHISTELIPIRFIDMARPRPMTIDEEAWFLDMMFDASGW
jgi:poly-gamma-glutamate synthesis protein (capsule biosynthesis protein)